MLDITIFIDEVRNLTIAKYPNKHVSFSQLSIDCCASTDYLDILEEFKKRCGFKINNIIFCFQIYVLEDSSFFSKIKKEFPHMNSYPFTPILEYEEGLGSPNIKFKIDPKTRARVIEILKQDVYLYSIYKPLSSEIFLVTNENSKRMKRYFKGLVMELVLMYENDLKSAHAACISYNKKGILLIGPSRSGKTSFSIGFIQKGAKYVSNDRIFINSSNVALSFDFYSNCLRIKIGTIFHYPELKKFLDNELLAKYTSYSPAELWQLNNLDEITIKADDIFNKDRIITKTKIDYIIMPKISPYRDHTEIIEFNDMDCIINELVDCFFHPLLRWPIGLKMKKQDRDSTILFWKSVFSKTKIYKIESGLDIKKAVNELIQTLF